MVKAKILRPKFQIIQAYFEIDLFVFFWIFFFDLFSRNYFFFRPEPAIPSRRTNVDRVLIGYKRLQWRFLRGVSFIHHGDPRVAAVPESLSLLHSYLCM